MLLHVPEPALVTLLVLSLVLLLVLVVPAHIGRATLTAILFKRLAVICVGSVWSGRSRLAFGSRVLGHRGGGGLRETSVEGLESGGRH